VIDNTTDYINSEERVWYSTFMDPEVRDFTKD